MKLYSVQILMASAMTAEFAYNGPTIWFILFALGNLIFCLINLFGESQHIVQPSTTNQQGETKL